MDEGMPKKRTFAAKFWNAMAKQNTKQGDERLENVEEALSKTDLFTITVQGGGIVFVLHVIWGEVNGLGGFFFETDFAREAQVLSGFISFCPISAKAIDGESHD